MKLRDIRGLIFRGYVVQHYFDYDDPEGLNPIRDDCMSESVEKVHKYESSDGLPVIEFEIKPVAVIYAKRRVPL